MPNIQLRTGNTIYVSCFDYYFRLKEEDVELFFQSCEADNLGIMIEDPFAGTLHHQELDLQEEEEEGLVKSYIESQLFLDKDT